MATYCNQHWLLSHIRNSFISTDDTGMCETVMASDDLPKHYLRKFQTEQNESTRIKLLQSQNRKSTGNSGAKGQNQQQRPLDPILQRVEFVCYPGLDEDDDEDLDLSTQSFDIQMYPVGAHRLRSNTALKLEKLEIARRKAARTKSVNFEDEIISPERSDFFVRKILDSEKTINDDSSKNKDLAEAQKESRVVKSKLTIQLANTPKQAQNKFMEYARFDGTSQTGIHTKRINVFLSMLPERDRSYPIKICVIASAKIIEVIGLVCYKATIQYPEVPLKSIRHYALYMTEDNDDMEDFPPLDNREPCSKFGFSQLTLAERRPLANVTRIDYHNNLATKSMTSEEDKARLAAAASLEVNFGAEADISNGFTAGEDQLNEYEKEISFHNEMLEAPMYRTYHVHIIDKRFFKTEVTLGISGERIEIDQHKNAKFWTKQKAVTYPIEAIGFCEIVERRQTKAVLRIWLRSSSNAMHLTSSTPPAFAVIDIKSVGGSSSASNVLSGAPNLGTSPHSPTSPSHYSHFSSPFGFLTTSSCSTGYTQPQQQPIRFKHYDLEGDQNTIEQICNKLNCILEVRSSEVRREFLEMRERKLEKTQAKKHLKM